MGKRPSPVNDYITSWLMKQPVGATFSGSALHNVMRAENRNVAFSVGACNLALHKLAESDHADEIIRGVFRLTKTDFVFPPIQVAKVTPLIAIEEPKPSSRLHGAAGQTAILLGAKRTQREAILAEIEALGKQIEAKQAFIVGLDLELDTILPAKKVG